MSRSASSRKKMFPVIAASPSLISAMFSINDTDIRKAIEHGKLSVFKIGNRRRLLVEDVVAWLKTHPAGHRKPK
jgi:hypothetical protein